MVYLFFPTITGCYPQVPAGVTDMGMWIWGGPDIGTVLRAATVFNTCQYLPTKRLSRHPDLAAHKLSIVQLRVPG